MTLTAPDSNVLKAQNHRLRLRLRHAGFGGEILDDAGSRVAASTDNSIYQIVPAMVLAPLDEADVCIALAVLAEPDFVGIPVVARGGGTGTDGQALGSGIILDMRRHMTRILEINLAEGWVEVEPGIVLRALNMELESSGLFFAPTTSTANRCTIGGMVGTDASGKGSRIYGKTSDNVLGLRLALEGGRILDSNDHPPEWAMEMLAATRDACDSGRPALLSHVPELSRRFTGYDLERARPNLEQFDWWRLLLGAEGTLGVTTRIRLKLRRRPTHNCLVVLAFDSFTSALDAAQQLLTSDPLAIEAMDELVLRLAEEAGLLEQLPIGLRGNGGPAPVYNFVEFVGIDEAEIEARLARLTDILPHLGGLLGHHVAQQAEEIAQLWSVREASVGLLGHSGSTRRPIAFVEDCVVPPDRLADFVTEFVAILQRHGLVYGIFGHIDVGCLHVRPALDIDNPADRTTLKAVSDEVYQAVKRHDGIFWGEHGKGIRGEYLADFVGREAYDAFRRIKLAFDPHERFNPGKLVAVALPLRSIDGTPMRRFNGPQGDPFGKAFDCNGNAACLNYSRTTPMCPSYKATNDLRHSPKGRAEIFRSWRQAHLANLASEEIEQSAIEVLDGCLGCNACSSRCPTHVDIPEMKSLFLNQYYTGRRRPLRDRLLMALERWASMLTTIRPLIRLSAATGATALMGRLLGMVDLPSPSARGIHDLGVPLARTSDLADFASDSRTVWILQDPFTSLFDVSAVGAVCHGLQRLGYRPVLLPLLPAGKAAHVLGDRRAFERQAAALSGLLLATARFGLPIVGIDPAQTLMLRQDYPRIKAGLPPVLLVQEFLLGRLSAGDRWPRFSAAPGTRILLHCTEVSANPASARQWQDVLAAMDIDVNIPDLGCCGMAGNYGHQARHKQTSHDIYNLSWSDQLESSDPVYVSGFSCRCQSKRFASRQVLHPMALLDTSQSRD